MSAPKLRAWLAYERVQLLLSYEIDRQLQRDSGLSRADFYVLDALSNAPDRTLPIAELAKVLGCERRQVPHHLRRMAARSLVACVKSKWGARITDAVLTQTGTDALTGAAAGHAAFVSRLLFDPLPPELIPAFTEALELIQARFDTNPSGPKVPLNSDAENTTT